MENSIKHKIVEEPQIPSEIINAVNNNNLVVFTGAGVSRLKPIECLGWDQLANNLIDKCFSAGKIYYKEKESLKKTIDHRKVITIVYKQFKENEELFWDEMKIALKEKEKIKRENIYEDVIGLRGVNITTNADTYIDEYFSANRIVYEISGFSPNNIDRTKVYHLHGSINNPDSMIFTLPRYFKLYQADEVGPFLRKIFQENVVLFIGYGLGEFELLEYLFLHNSDKTCRRFALLPYYKGEENLYNMEQTYFDDMGITIIPFALDNLGYEQLSVIIKNWRKEINSLSKYAIDSIKEIEDVLVNPSGRKIERVLQLVRNESSKEEYLFTNFDKAKKISLWLKYLKSRGYLDTKNIPLQFKDDKDLSVQKPWLPVYYLHAFSINRKKISNKQLLNEFYRIIDEVIDYEQHVINENPYAIPYQMKEIIYSLPKTRFAEKHIEYIRFGIEKNHMLVSRDIFEILIPKLLRFRKKELILKTIDLILSYKKVDNELNQYRLSEYISIIDSYYLPKIIDKYYSDLYKMVGVECYNLALKKLNEIIRSEKSSFNMIRIRTIEDHPQSRFTDRYEYQLIHFLRNVLLIIGKKQITPVLQYLFWRKHPIYTRLALNTIRCRYTELKDYFWNWAKFQKNPFDHIEWKHELWEMIRDNSKLFSHDEIRLVIRWVESKDFGYFRKSDYTNEEINAGIAYRKREWLLALEKSEHPEVNRRLEDYSRINPAKIDHPGFDIWMGDMEIKEPKTTSDDLLKMSNIEILQLLREFTGPQRYPRHGDSVYDLHNALEYCVRENPQRFVDDLNSFRDCDLAYSSAIISGLKDAWNAKKDFKWEPVFRFIEHSVFDEKFWEYQLPQDSFNYRNWMIETVSALISTGVSNPERSFPLEYIDRAEAILLLLAHRTKSDLSFSGDLITAVFNTTKGHVYEGLLIFSIGYAKIYKSSESQRWHQPIKDFFKERIINHPENTPEVWVNIGRFFNNLIYLDRDWVLTNINSLFPINENDHWKSSFMAYLFFSQIYGDIYKLFKVNGHYQKAINTEFEKVSLNEDIRAVLMTHVAIGYLCEWELLADDQSLIRLVLHRKDPVQFKELVNYFWRSKKEGFDSIMRAKLIDLWRELIGILKGEENNANFQESIAYLALFVSKIDTIDEEMIEWIVFSTKYAGEHHVLYLLVEYLKPLSKTSPENVAKIYLDLLANDIVPDFDEKDVKETIESIYQSGKKDLGDKICNGYIEHGSLILREIYEKYNSD